MSVTWRAQYLIEMTSELSSYTWHTLCQARARIEAEMEARLARDPYLGYTEALYAWCDPQHTLHFRIVDVVLTHSSNNSECNDDTIRQCVVLHVPELETTFTLTRRKTCLKNEASRVIQFHHDTTQHTWSTLHWRYSTKAKRDKWIHQQPYCAKDTYYAHVIQSYYFKMISSHFMAIFDTLCRYRDNNNKTCQNGARVK